MPVYGPSGSSAHLRSVARALVSMGHHVHVAALRDVDGRGRFGRVLPCSVTTLSGARGPTGLRRLSLKIARRWLARQVRGRFDWVWERASVECTAGWRLARRLGARHLVELNAPMALEHGHDPTQADVLRRADRVIAVSPWLSRFATRLGARSVRMVGNGSDLENSSTPSGELRLCHHGSLRTWHGLARLPAILDALPEATAWVVGRGEVPAHPRIRAVHHQDRRGLQDVLAGASVLVCPFEDHSPPWLDPLKIRDARAVGLPVVSSVHPAGRLADGQACIRDPRAWAREIRALAGVRTTHPPRTWRQVCSEALSG